jgi:hypothetical protein
MTRISDDEARAMLARFEQGTTTLQQERERWGFAGTGAIRRALTKLVGAARATALTGGRPAPPAEGS